METTTLDYYLMFLRCFMLEVPGTYDLLGFVLVEMFAFFDMCMVSELFEMFEVFVLCGVCGV